MSIVVGVEVPGAVGLNVTSRPASSTAVHWLADGHATPCRELPLSIVVGVEVSDAVGLNVPSRPMSSTAVHWLADGHATPSGRVPGSGARAGGRRAPARPG